MPASTMVLVGLLKGGRRRSGAPLRHASSGGGVAAAVLCDAIDKTALLLALLAALGNFLDGATGRLVTFCAYLPPESVAACSEKEITTIMMFKAGMMKAAAI